MIEADERAIGAGSYLLRNVKVKAQIEKPLRKEIVERTQQDSILWTILGCGFTDLVAPITTTLVPAARSDRTHLPGCHSLVGGAPSALTGRLVPKTSSLLAERHPAVVGAGLGRERYIVEWPGQTSLSTRSANAILRISFNNLSAHRASRFEP